MIHFISHGCGVSNISAFPCVSSPFLLLSMLVPNKLQKYLRFLFLRCIFSYNSYILLHSAHAHLYVTQYTNWEATLFPTPDTIFCILYTVIHCSTLYLKRNVQTQYELFGLDNKCARDCLSTD